MSTREAEYLNRLRAAAAAMKKMQVEIDARAPATKRSLS